jgi:hypothetical protein
MNLGKNMKKLQERDPEVEKSERNRGEEEIQDDCQPGMHLYLEYREFLLQMCFAQK